MSIWSNSQATETDKALGCYKVISTVCFPEEFCCIQHRCTFVQRGFFVLAADVGVGARLQEALHT